MKKNEATGKEIYRILTNNEITGVLYKNENEDIVFEDGTIVANINDDDCEEKIDEFEENWIEVNWSNEDWADYYGCSEDEIDDCYMDDMRD